MEQLIFLLIALVSWIVQLYFKKQKKAKKQNALLNTQRGSSMDQFHVELEKFSKSLKPLLNSESSNLVAKKEIVPPIVIKDEVKVEYIEREKPLKKVKKRVAVSLKNRDRLKEGVIIGEILKTKF